MKMEHGYKKSTGPFGSTRTCPLCKYTIKTKIGATMGANSSAHWAMLRHLKIHKVSDHE